MSSRPQLERPEEIHRPAQVWRRKRGDQLGGTRKKEPKVDAMRSRREKRRIRVQTDGSPANIHRKKEPEKRTIPKRKRQSDRWRRDGRPAGIGHKRVAKSRADVQMGYFVWTGSTKRFALCCLFLAQRYRRTRKKSVQRKVSE